MKLDLHPDLKASEALAHLAPARQFRMAAAFVGKPLFNFGDIHFQNTNDLKDRIILSAMKARLQPARVHCVITPTFASVSCRTKKDFSALMHVVHGEYYAGGRSLSVQVTDQSAEWHKRAITEFVNPANDFLLHQNQSLIDVIHTSDRRRDYYFPTLQTMKKFCQFVETKLPADTKPVELAARLG